MRSCGHEAYAAYNTVALIVFCTPSCPSRAPMAPTIAHLSLHADFAHLPEPPEPLDDTLGVLLIGNLVALILYGFTLHQAYHYARSYPEDRRCPRLLVWLALTFETVSSVLGVHACYHYAVKDYYHPGNLQVGIWFAFSSHGSEARNGAKHIVLSRSLNLYPLIAGLPMVISQSFFARRLWKLGQRYRLVVVLS
ncbi:hypothetical protein BD413DRAFT_135133 [Trametes elegans]|nr:hypothetical protein BD413DRAFT_135133 [Trametes elegans]